MPATRSAIGFSVQRLLDISPGLPCCGKSFTRVEVEPSGHSFEDARILGGLWLGIHATKYLE